MIETFLLCPLPCRINGLKDLYKTRLLPVEKLYSYHHFFSHQMSDAEFDAKPQVLMIGQYSTGKTSVRKDGEGEFDLLEGVGGRRGRLSVDFSPFRATSLTSQFIKYLIGRDFPGQRIGPEPTTDRFVCVMNGPDERVVPGNALSVSPDLPYHGLQQFGVSFLNKLEGAQLPSPVLRNISIVDTPGILSGEKQRVQRGYDFTTVCGWFAERADLILLLFDAHKLDISDEFRTVIESLKVSYCTCSKAQSDKSTMTPLRRKRGGNINHLRPAPRFVFPRARTTRSAASSTRPTRWTGRNL